MRVQCSYTGGTELLPTSFITSMKENNKVGRAQRTSKETDVEEPIEKQEEASITKKVEERDESKYKKKSDNGMKKRKTPKEEIDSCSMEFDRQLPAGKPTEYNEKHKLECLWIREFTGSEKAAGSRGGLCLAWKDDIEVALRSFSKTHIDVMIKDERDKKEWRFTGFYGTPYANNKNASWNLLKILGKDKTQPWLVSEDFNEMMYSFEKRGGIPREEKRMAAFCETFEECQLRRHGIFRGLVYMGNRQLA
ncbi:hypothetical protein Goshw_010165 [Gossypium schwendimanii]|uniref:Reverse transcriptase n=1 Tax=Gossypium schwendimanii TaxID=34291 RepID=A0A7J9KWY5_GOSSC|nr:hypothetical protein [Gossypium schwendimanii]